MCMLICTCVRVVMNVCVYIYLCARMRAWRTTAKLALQLSAGDIPSMDSPSFYIIASVARLKRNRSEGMRVATRGYYLGAT